MCAVSEDSEVGCLRGYVVWYVCARVSGSSPAFVHQFGGNDHLLVTRIVGSKKIEKQIIETCLAFHHCLGEKEGEKGRERVDVFQFFLV